MAEEIKKEQQAASALLHVHVQANALRSRLLMA